MRGAFLFLKDSPHILTCNRLMNISLKLGNQRELMKKRRNGYEFLPIKESEFMKLSFVQIFDDFVT